MSVSTPSPLPPPPFSSRTLLDLHSEPHAHNCLEAPPIHICQHMSAYVSTRQHTSAYARPRQHTSAYVSIRQHKSASTRQHTSAYVSIRQYTPAYVSEKAPHQAHAAHLSNLPPLSPPSASARESGGPGILWRVRAAAEVRHVPPRTRQRSRQDM